MKIKKIIIMKSVTMFYINLSFTKMNKIASEIFWKLLFSQNLLHIAFYIIYSKISCFNFVKIFYTLQVKTFNVNKFKPL